MEDYNRQNSQSKTKEWFYNAFLPFMDKVKIKLITWEKILEHIKGVDNESYNMLNAFYSKCKRYCKRGFMGKMSVTLCANLK